MLVYRTKWHVIYAIISRPNGYPKPDPYPVGTGTGIKFYPLDFAGTGMPYSFGYRRGRVFTLPTPYPTRCHPYPQWTCHSSSPSHRRRINGRRILRCALTLTGSRVREGIRLRSAAARHRALAPVSSAVGEDAGEEQHGRDTVRNSPEEEKHECCGKIWVRMFLHFAS